MHRLGMVYVNFIQSRLQNRSMKNIEILIPSAIEIVKTDVLNNSKEVPKEFNGYISSFGASITMSGLLPTLVFYSQEGKSKGNRRSVIDSIEKIIKKNYPNLLVPDDTLLKKIITLKQQQTTTEFIRLHEKIKEAAIALKLAIRIFPKSKETTNE